MRPALPRIGIIRLVAASAVLAGFVFALVLSASPHLHAAAHDTERDGTHECLVMALQGGACGDSISGPDLSGFVEALFEVRLLDVSRTAESIFLSCQILEHAPPVIS